MWRAVVLIPVWLMLNGAAPPPGKSAAPRIATLESLLAFANPRLCEPTKGFDDLLGRLMRVSGNPDNPTVVAVDPVVPAALQRQFGKGRLSQDGNYYAVTVPVTGTWHGLKLRAIEAQQIMESEGGFAMHFEATPQQVRAVLNRLGFGLGNAMSVYRDPDDIMGVSIEIGRVGNRAVLTCFAG